MSCLRVCIGLVMIFTYKGSDELARVAHALFKRRAEPCPLSPFVAMGDPTRMDDICQAAQGLPRGAALVYRHFGAHDKLKTARKLKSICDDKGLQFLIGADIELAGVCGAHGVHLPQKDMQKAAALRSANSEWVLSCAVHDKAAIQKANALPFDGVMLSSVFASESPSAGVPLGISGFQSLAQFSRHPVLALGGITPKNAHEIEHTQAAGLAGVSAFWPPYPRFEAINDLQAARAFGKTLADELAHIHGRCFDQGWPVADFNDHLARKTDVLQVCKIGGQICGFILTRCIAKEMDILTIAVLPENRGRGIGRELLARAENEARAGGVSLAILDVA
ncbi:MAG TPA: GNAT family N-acetyltransferase, partial [Hellea balneolensis]|nr:GNAT family N-acetyltransferase [Hellea balneolensis]